MNNAELLLPAGNIEKLQYAVAYGADAVYLGIVDFSLRSMKSGNIITADNLKKAVDTAHSMGVKAYVTINIFAHNKDIKKLEEFLPVLQDANPDGIIFGDPGFYSVLKKGAPNIPLHISTQANTLNSEAVKFWRDLGISRVILARELELKDIAEISKNVPDVELEALVHGSLCVAYSGRCLLSDYMTGNKKKANQGNCAQPCRWKYNLVEEKRQGEYYEIVEDGNGTYILNPKDLALVNYIPQLIEAGVHSFKIEGRTKSLYYASVTAKAYKRAINAHFAGKELNTEELLKELSLVGNRGFTTGYLLGEPDVTHYNYSTSKGVAGATILATIKNKLESKKFEVLARNQIKLGDDIEFITPKEQISYKIAQIINEKNETVEKADTNENLVITLEGEQDITDNWNWGIIRRKENKNGILKTNLYCGTCN